MEAYDPTRRSFLTGRFMTEEFKHPYLQRCRFSAARASRARRTAAFGHGWRRSPPSVPSKIVIVLEGPDSGVLGARLLRSHLSGVLSANMVFEQIERIGGPWRMINVPLTPRHAESSRRRHRRGVANITVPAVAQPVAGGVGSLEIKWSKAPCRFCGTGCGVMVGVKEGKVVATHGDMQAEVNRGLNCIKGYFLSKIMYGDDRLTTPLLRKKNGVYDKDGEFEPVSWDEAFDVMAEQCKQVLKDKGPDRRRHVRLRPVDDLGRLCRDQADARRLPLQQSRPQCASLHGVRRLRLHADIRHG